jgi:hypothetical protein
MESIIKKLKLNDEFTKNTPKQKVFNKVKNDVPPIKNYNFQADILYLPTTKEGYKYLLVCIDLASNRFDIEPLKTKDSKATLEAFKNMFKRSYIKQPKVSLRTDNGTEFKDEFDKFLVKNNIFHSVSLPYRHKQLANVESLNKQLALLFNLYMNTREIESGEQYSEWTDILKSVRRLLNKHRKIELPKFKDWIDNSNDDILPILNNTEKPKFKVGNIVHHKLEIPKNALNNEQPTTNFRVGDMKYNPTPKKIVKIIDMPDKPFFRYILEGMPNVSYGITELIKAKPTEKETKYEIERFIKKQTIKKKTFYLVKWKGYTIKDATYEPEELLIKDLGKIHFHKLVSLMKKE